MTQDNSLTIKLQPLKGTRQSGESDAAVIACNDWLRMGSGRSLVGLLKHYQDLSSFSSSFTPPTESEATLQTWSSRYSWADRKVEYDNDLEQQKSAYAQHILQQSLASRYGRLERLMRLAEFLEGQLYEQTNGGTFHNVWLQDVKQIGSGDSVERVDIERFNTGLFVQYRGVLDDIAKEVGERANKHEHTGADGGDLTFTLVYPERD